MTCPQCQQRVPLSVFWTAKGLSGLSCPNCHVSLCPTPLSAILVFALSFGLGNATLILLRHKGMDFLAAFAGFFVVFAAVYAVIAPAILRMRVKEQPRTHLSGHQV
ncbi:MAG: hypothetical protein WB630_11930 [Candidatus Acidiferrales bacterium]